MNRKMLLVIAALWMASLVGVTVWAQARVPAPVLTPDQNVAGIITGDNIGFIPSPGQKASKGKVIGRLVVKVNGQWLEVEAPATIVR